MSSSETKTEPRSEAAEVARRGFVATFLSGLFAILPLALTVAIVGWVAQKVLGAVGPDTAIGSGLRSVGLRFVTDPWVAQFIGWAIVLFGVWFLGLLVRTRARLFFDRVVDAVIHRIPIVKGVYGTAQQVFRLLEKRDESEVKGMSVVFCAFGEGTGAGFLCLLATPEVFVFEDRSYHFVYLPTSPVPMTGGIILVPVESVTPLTMSVEKLLEIYLSMGILASDTLPTK